MRLLLFVMFVGVLTLFGAACTTTQAVTDAVDVSVNNDGGCFTNQAGGVECWGQLKDSSSGESVEYGNTAMPISSIASGATDIELGDSHACAVVVGSVWCWGTNQQGNLGHGDSSQTFSPDPVLVDLPVGSVTVQISAFRDHTCARLDDGAAWCWGAGSSGRLGDGNSVDAYSPVMVAGLNGTPGNKITDITAGGYFTCASRPNGTVGCWGSDSLGQLGNGPGASSSTTPVPVAGLSNVVGIEAGSEHVCTASSTGLLHCWGANDQHQISTGTETQLDEPTVYSEFSGTGPHFAGSDGRSCLVLASGTVECVGEGVWGSLGQGSFSSSPVPVPVLGTDTAPAAMTDADFFFGCLIQVDGQLLCWGNGAFGRLGSGADENSSTPVPVVRGP